MDTAVREAINTLRDDRVHGASWLTMQAIKILGNAAKASDASTVSNLFSELKKVAAALLMSRPGMVSVANYILKFTDELESQSAVAHDVKSLKKILSAFSTRLLKHCRHSSYVTIQNASAVIKSKSIIMTCSYSSTVCGTLQAAGKNGLDFRVMAADSSSGGKLYGRLTARRLVRYGIVTKIFPDDQIGWRIAAADMVLLGADAVSNEGWMINGTPSFELCRWASRRKKPVYVVCETAKVDVHGILAPMHEPVEGFDRVPLDLIKAFITERGMIGPEETCKIKSTDLFYNLK